MQDLTFVSELVLVLIGAVAGSGLTIGYNHYVSRKEQADLYGPLAGQIANQIEAAQMLTEPGTRLRDAPLSRWWWDQHEGEAREVMSTRFWDQIEKFFLLVEAVQEHQQRIDALGEAGEAVGDDRLESRRTAIGELTRRGLAILEELDEAGRVDKTDLVVAPGNPP